MSFRTRREIRRVNIGKTIVLGAVALLLVWLLIADDVRPAAVAPTAEPAAVALNPTPPPVETSASVASPTFTPVSTAVPTATPSASPPLPTPTETPTIAASPSPPAAEATPPAGTPAAPEPTAPVEADALPKIVSPADGERVAGNSILIEGVGEPRTEIEILDSGEVITQFTVPDRQNWEFYYYTQGGEHRLTVRRFDQPETESEPVTVRLDKPPINPDCENPTPGQDLGDRYIVGECESLSQIARRLNIDYGELLVVNPELEDPNKLLPGQTINLPPR